MRRKIRVNTLFTFHSWKRKGHAVFSSLGRVVRIGVLSVVYSLVTQAAPAQKGEVPDTLQMREVELDEVVVTVARSPVQVQQISRMVTLVSRADIERAPAQSLSDLLRFLPSADIRQRGPLGAQSDISIRGGTFEQTLILLNGINVTDPQTGHHHLNLPVDPESIQRIEFLSGPAARVFGPNAFSGAINLITGNPRKNHLRLSASAGAYGLLRAGGNISLESGKTSHFLSSGITASEGYTHNTDFSGTSLFYQAEKPGKRGIWSFQSGLNTRKFGANGFYSLKYPEQYEATGTLFVSGGYRPSKSPGLSVALFLRHHRDRFELIRNNPVVPFNFHRSLTSGLNLNYSRKWTGGTTAWGMDVRNEQILSNLLGNRLSRPRFIPGEETHLYTRSAHRLGTSIYAEHRFSSGRVTLTPGVMVHLVAGGGGLQLFPGMDGAFRITKSLSLFGSANKTLRMPTFTDMYYASPVQQGNPRLNPEEAFTGEGGIRIHHHRFRGGLSLFRRQGKELIDWVKDPSPDSLVWRSMNHARVSMQGLEFSLRYFSDRDRGNPENFRLEGAAISWTLLSGRSTERRLLSRYTMDYLRHQVNASVEAAMGMRWSASFRISWRDRHGAWPDREGRIIAYRPVTLADARLSWQKDFFTLFAEASNLFNSQWMDFGGISQPGIWLTSGIKFDIGL